MSALGAFIVAVIFGVLGASFTGIQAVGWLLFCFSAIIGVPLGFIADIAYGMRQQRFRREDARQERSDLAISRAIRHRRPDRRVNIDARSVHVHQNENTAHKGFVEKP